MAETGAHFATRGAVDFVIIGCGSAGGVLAKELSTAGYSVVVLELGPYRRHQDFRHDEFGVFFGREHMGAWPGPDPQTFRLTSTQAAAVSMPPAMPPAFYARTVVGASAHFSGNFWRLRPLVFDERSRLGPIAGTGFADWPISYEELEPYWLDPNVDGVKTGFTESAGYCLIASAKRGPRRLLSVVLGTNSDGLRAQESQKLLNYGFQFYEVVRLYEKGQEVSRLRVWKGAANELRAGTAGDLSLVLPRGDAQKLKADLVSEQPLVAPVSAGQRVGTIKVSLDGKSVGEYPVVALESVAGAGILGRTWDSMRLWLK